MVFENETQPDARRASESTTFKLGACLRWRRMPTLTVACSEAFQLAGAEGRLVSLGRCSPVTPLPSLSSPWLRILRRTSARGTAMHTDRTIPGWQALGNTFPTILSDFSVPLHSKDLDAAGEWREAGKG